MDRDLDRLEKIVRMEHAAGLGRRVASELRAYWEALRAGRDMPRRSEIDPRGIERALEYAFILERIAPGVGRFRLAGMHLNELMGMEVRGMPLTALFTAQARDRVMELCEEVTQTPAVVEMLLSAESGIGRPPLTARLVLLPLRSDLGDVTRMLGCLVAEGSGIGRAPRRFDLAGAESHTITVGSPVPAVSPAPLAPDALGFAEPQATFTPAPAGTPEQRRAQFRVVKSDE